jgi:membrane protein implicated in regulation of membrane protease activity
MIMTLAYFAFAALGCGYIVVSIILGHVGHDAGDGFSGHSAHGSDQVTYGVEGHGHGSASADGDGSAVFHFPFFSPLAVAMLFASIGAFGLIAKYGLRVGDSASLAIALPAALLTAYIVTYIGWRLVVGSRGTSTIRLADLRGAAAEVTTPIPAGGVGEVAAVVQGQRYNSAAREADGKPVPRGARVTVREMVGTTLVVVWEGPGGGAQ